jgi:hypothetical protein
MFVHEDEIIDNNKNIQQHHIRKNELKALQELVYCPNVNCDRRCDSTMWWDMDLFAILAQIYKCSVVTFIGANEFPKLIISDGVNGISTNHCASSSDVPHLTTEEGQKNTLYCIFQNIPMNEHYIWLRPKPVAFWQMPIVSESIGIRILAISFLVAAK